MNSNTNATGPVIVGYARTPLMRFNGVFAGVSAVELGAHAARAALERAGVSPEQVNITIGGQVLQAGAGQNPARQSAVGAGVPLSTPGITYNAVCLSGAEAVSQAARLVRSEEAEIVLVIGQESMSSAPHAASLRAGTKYGAVELLDTVESDALTDAFLHMGMGELTERGNRELGLTRESQDAIAVQSHQRAAASAGFLAGEIEPYTVSGRKGDRLVSADDGVRPETTLQSVSRLRPAFTVDGTLTAANSSQITDGAAALVVTSRQVADRYELSPLATIAATAFTAGPDVSLHSQPSQAILQALGRVSGGAAPADLAIAEINEAFAAVSLQSARDLGLDLSQVNQHGGAIALGHPLGASGTRIVGTLARQLAGLGTGALGAAALCGGGGQGSAVILRAV